MLLSFQLLNNKEVTLILKIRCAISAHRIFFFNLATDFSCSNMANCHVFSRLTYLANNLYIELYRILLLLDTEMLIFYLLSDSFKEN